SAFSTIGRGSSNSIAVATDFLYISGRAKLFNTDPDVLLRVVDRSSNLIAFPQLQLVWASIDARGLQLRHPHPSRLYLAAGTPPPRSGCATAPGRREGARSRPSRASGRCRCPPGQTTSS